MDQKQSDHLKAYGVAYNALERGVNVEWLLNYRGGSFMMDYYQELEQECIWRGVAYRLVSGVEVISIYAEIDNNNMEKILLEKAPRVAVYTPPDKKPWDDAVTMALTYAEIPYEKVWDIEVAQGKLDEYDWLHLHHEDFTGQYGRFYANYHTAQWYQNQQAQYELTAKQLGFKKVSELKKFIARSIKEYTGKGGFLFAMCAATDTYDIALAAEDTDICAAIYDGDPAEPGYQSKLDYSRTFAFEDFSLRENAYTYEFSDIDYPPGDGMIVRTPEEDYFTLFEFSAKYDPVPTMLTQNHVSVVKGFLGQTTSFRRDRIKENVLIMGEDESTGTAKYLHGSFGKGTFTFYAGHDPEDYAHQVGEAPTDLSLHKSSPGYRLILNNVLFPAAKKKERKT